MMYRIFFEKKLIAVLLIAFFLKGFAQDKSGVRIVSNKNSSLLEIRNGLLGLVIPKDGVFDPKNPKNTLAPIQSVIYSDGSYSNDSAVYLQSAVPPASMTVKVVSNTTQLAVIVISYTFNKPQFVSGKQTYKGGDAGPGYYKITISLKKGLKYAVMEEESDYDVLYEFKISNGLQPDRARYRGWNSSSVELGYEPSGSVYRPEDKRAPLDATIDLHYDKLRIYPYLSLWDASGGEINTGRYWQIFNNSAPAGANMLGYFQGRASRLLGASYVGPRLILRPAKTPGANGQLPNVANIQVSVARRGPDNVWYPKKRFQWALYVTTKSDLLPPDQYQPIGREMNIFSGLATKIDDYAKKPAAIIPAFFDGAIYIQPNKMQALISQVKTNVTFYNRLNGMDPYFKQVTDAWRFPDSAYHAINNFILFGEKLKNTFKNGDGVHAFATQYWKGSFTFKKIAQEISCLFADKNIHITAAQKDSLLQVVRMMARIEWDDDNVPFFDSAGINFGPANMSYQYSNNGRYFFSMLFAHDPEFAGRAKQVVANTRSNIMTAIFDNGVSFGTPHYTQATMDPILFSMLQLKQAGIADLFVEQKTRIAKFIDFYSALLTPPSVRFSGYRKLISFGDGSEESAVTFGLLASGYSDSDPGLSKRMNGIFQHGAPRLSLFGDVIMAIDFSNEYPLIFNGGNGNYTGYLSHFRTGVNSENETAAWIINGNKYSDHRNDDAGEIAIYALKAPLSLSRSCFYYPRVSDARIRSLVVPETAFPEWNRGNQPLGNPSIYDAVWNNSQQVEFASLGNSSVSLSEMGTKDTSWYRRMMMITIKQDQPVIVFYDSVNNNKPNIWSFLCMSHGAVTTPAGPIIPPDKIYDYKNPKQQELPEASPEKGIGGGLNRFTFTGQDWTTKMHSTGGINWDLYTAMGNPASFTIAQWTNNWQNSLEAGEFLQTNGRPYFEMQQIIRIKSSQPFFHVLLPYFKGTEPYQNKVQLVTPGKIRIRYGDGDLLVTSFSYYYSGTDKMMAASFSNQPVSENGIGITGGITEVEIAGNDIKIRVHGNSGRRIISLPFAVEMSGKNPDASINSKNNAAQVTIDYKSSGMDLLSTEKGFTEYHLKKKG